MMRSGTVYLRQRLAHGIKGKGSGLWGTPRNSDGMNQVQEINREFQPREAVLPTPSTLDHTGTGRMNTNANVKKYGGVNSLGEMAATGKWPMFPTIHAQEPGWKVGGEVEVVDKDGNPPEHWNQRFYDKNTGRVVQKGLTQVVQMWPTPVRRDWKDGTSESCKNVPVNGLLGRAIHKYPTPNSRDWKGSPGKGCRERGGHQSSLPATIKEREGGGSLNPTWVEWLMGFPLHWTDIGQESQISPELRERLRIELPDLED